MQRYHAPSAVLVLMLFAAGCEPVAKETGPSYAQLVETLNAELQTLEHLEARRDKLRAERDTLRVPEHGDAAPASLDDVLASAKDAIKDQGGIDASDPEALLDDLAGRSGQAEALAGQLLEGILDAAGAGEAAPELTEEQRQTLLAEQTRLDDEIAKLDEEIAAQQDRVARAKAARDAAEPKP